MVANVGMPLSLSDYEAAPAFSCFTTAFGEFSTLGRDVNELL
jgi:hypothetical protein